MIFKSEEMTGVNRLKIIRLLQNQTGNITTEPE